MATALDQATRDAVMAEANARAQRFGISPEQALYNYARENNISNADVDTYMGYAPGSADAWVRLQRDAGMAAKPSAPQVQLTAPQGNSYTAPSTPAASPATTAARQPLYAGLSNNSFPSGIARAYHEWSAANGGDTPANQAAAQNYLSSLGINQNTIEAAYNAYQAPVSSVRQAPVAPAPQAQQPAPQGNSYTAPSTPAASPATTAARQPLYAGLSNNSNANDIAAAYRQWSGANGGDTTDNQRAAESYLQSLGIGSGAINDAYNSYKAPQPLYAGLNNNSSASDIASAYRQWSSANGGDTTDNQRAAESYLQSLGIGSGAINDAYNSYKGQQQPQQQPSQNLGIGGSYNPQQNPYLGQMGRDIGSQMFDNWSRTQMPSIRSGAMAAGGFGGSRQGVVEANGMNDMNRQYGQALTSMYGNDWSQQQGRNLQQQGLNNSYDLGLRSNDLQNRSVNNSYDLGLRSSDLGFANLDANINQNNFGNQMQAANFGLGVYNTLNNQTQSGINAGTNIQNTPLDYQKYFTNSANGVGSGYSTGTTSQTNQGNPLLGALGGAVLGNQFQKNWSI